MMIQRPNPVTVPVRLRRDLLTMGWNDRAISAKLRSKEWVRIRHGTYTDTRLWTQLNGVGRHEVLTRAVLGTARSELVVSHVSAAVLHGVPTWGLSLDDVHVTRVDGRIGRHEAGVHQHGGALAEDDVVHLDEPHRIAVTHPTRAALEVCTSATVEAAMSVVSLMMHAGLTSPELLRQRYEREGKSMVRWPHSRITDVVLRLADPRFESVGECRTFHLMWHAHLPLPTPQYEVFDENGQLVGRVDFAWPELGVFLEFDGKIKYEKLLKPGQRASDVVVREKRREELICRLTGWRCLRLVWADLQRPHQTAALIRAFLFEPRAAG